MALTELQTNVVLDVYDHDGTRPQIKSIALDDNTRYVFARLTYKGQTYDIGSGATVKLIIIRPDKVGAQVIGEAKEYEDYNEDETVSNVYGAYAELDQPAIAVAGTLLGQFIITSGDQILRSQIFAVNNGEALDADEWAGQYDGYNLDELVERVDNAVEKVDGMEADVSELKSGLINLSSGKQTISGVFSYGVFNASNMPETDPRKFNAVMMTAETYNRDITLTAKDGYNFLAYFYDENDNYVSKSPRWESSRYVPKNTYFRLWVRQNPLDTSIVLDLDTVKQQILFNIPIQDEIEASTKKVELANANVNLNGVGLQMIDTSFAYGTMNTQTGQAVSDTAYKYQVIMPNYVTYDRDVTIKCNSGYRYQVWWYNEDDTYISRTGSFKTDADEYTVTAGTHFRLFVTLNPPQSGAVVPIETFASNVFIKTQIGDRVTAVETKPLSTLPEYVLNTLSYRPVGVLSKGYILLSCDDGTEGLATYTIPMLINKNVPATFGLLMTSPVITNENYLATVIDAVENHGCCVAQHGSAQWTTYAEDTLNKYFDDTEALFTEKGITEIHGAICPGGAVADTNTLVQAMAGGRFGAVFSGGMQGELKYGNYNAVGARTNMYAMARYSAIGFTQQTYQAAIDEAYDNHYILCPFWHDYSVVNDTAKQAIIESMIDYAKAKGLTFITMADLPNII